MTVRAQDTVPLLGNSSKHLPRSLTGPQTPGSVKTPGIPALRRALPAPGGGINKPFALFWERGRNVRGRLLQ